MSVRPSRRAVRATTAFVAVLCVALLAASFLAGAPATTTTPQPAAPASDSQPADSLTVVTTQGFFDGTHPGARQAAKLVAYRADGTVVYENNTHGVYFDVDPVPGTRYTVEYVAANRVGADRCPSARQCTRNFVERVNLSTGAVTRVYEEITPQFDGGRWHDVDRLNGTHLVVADIVADRVYVVDTRTSTITWQWEASDHYDRDQGGSQLDWTHLNDVEVLPDGRIMASVRNMDEVVFLEPGEGVQSNWTLGDDDAHEVLFEQHNPDFIPADRGGPAVVVADSENNRVIEYRREAGEWVRTWSWRDRRLQWPRDADRLPGGHTLVVDSHGDRVFEVDRDGAVVWQVEIARAYDAERLGTGDESTGGFAAGTTPDRTGAATAGAPPATTQGVASGGSALLAIKDALPPVVVNGLLFVAPAWVSFPDLLVAGVLLVDLLLWGGLEWRWADRSPRDVVRRFRL